MRARTESLVMMLPFVLLLAATTLASPRCTLRLLAALNDDDLFPKTSPFEAVTWEDETAHVVVGGETYVLVALDGHAADDVVAFARERFDDRWKKRFEEDLPWLLAEMGHDVGRFCELELERADGERVTLRRVELTEENRRAIWEAAHAPGGRGHLLPDPSLVPRVERTHADTIDRRYATLARVVPGRPSPALERDAIRADLDQLEWHVRHEHSYRDLRGVDVAAAFDTARTALTSAESPDSIDVGTFALTVAKLVATFGDGHGRVSGSSQWLPGPYLPFLVFDTADGPVAVRPGRTGFVDPERPRVTELDGVDVDRWIEAAARFAPHGSPQFRRLMGTDRLRYVQAVRTELGSPRSDTIEVELARLDGGDARHATLSLVDEQPRYGSPLLGGSRRIGDVGYLRIPRMDDEPEVLDALTLTMERFRDTRGLVVDVRQNGGGSRAILRHLMPYFLDPDEAHVANVGRYRLRAGNAADDPNGFLQNRWLYPAVWPGWSDAAREAIARHAAAFEPEWSPPVDDEFSARHWLVLERSANPDAYRYGRPVVVLTDAGSFSATDIFVGAFAGRPNVTLVGQATGGGSGRSQRVRLAHSGVRVRLSTMISYRPNGRLYDGNGIAPDVEVPTKASDVVGRTDGALERALALLEAR